MKPGTAYPAVLFFTGASDTRVDPLHARKMTALLQAASSSGRPVLLHYSLAGGHSAGVSVEQQIQDDADQLAFLWTETGQPAGTQVIAAVLVRRAGAQTTECPRVTSCLGQALPIRKIRNPMSMPQRRAMTGFPACSIAGRISAGVRCGSMLKHTQGT